MRLTIALIATIFTSFCVNAQVIDDGKGHPFPAFESNMVIDSPLYDNSIEVNKYVPEFSFDGISNNLVANISVENCGNIQSKIYTKMVPNIIDAGMSAHLEVTIINEITDPNATCQNEALAIIPPVKLDIPIQIGNSNLLIRHPEMQHVEYQINVSYQPEGIVLPTVI